MRKLRIDEVKSTLVKHAFPVDIVVETISYCNLRCIMCPQPTLKRQRGEMTFDIFKKIADEIAKESPSSRLWLALMGESLMLGDKIVAMIAYAKKQGVQKVILNTNARYLDAQMSDKLISSGLDEIIVGLDAFTSATYDKIRVGGDFQETVKNIEHLLSTKKEKNLSRPSVILQFIVMDENEHEVEQFKHYWLAKGATVKIRPKLGWGTGVEAKNLNLPDSERDFPCPWLNRTVSIHWSGKLAQCDADFEGNYSPGNVTTQSIKEIWEGELAGRRERHWRGDFTHDLCSKCKDWQAGRSEFFYPDEEKTK
jgi:radical SAM protein with 4Fe4S-binding SPASM domain